MKRLRKPKRLAALMRSPEMFFLSVFLSVGGLFLFLIPPFQVADENTHFMRAYQLSVGNLVPENITTGAGGQLPASIPEFIGVAGGWRDQHDVMPYHPRKQIAELWRVKLLPGQATTEVNITNVAVYHPVNYAVQALGVFAANIFTDRLLIMFYMSRIVTFLFFAFVVYWAIRLLPVGKWAMAAVALLPMSLYEAVSLSADGFTLAMIALYVSLTVRLYMALRHRGVTGREWLALIAAGSMVALSKQGYVVFAVLPLILLRPYMARRPLPKIKLAWIGAAVAVPVMLFGFWTLAIRGLNKDMTFIQRGGIPNVRPDAQIEAILHDPLSFLSVLGNTLLTSNSNGIVQSFFGNFGWLNAPVPWWLALLLAVTLFLFFGFRENTAERLKRIPAAWIALLAIGNVVLVAAALYIYWSPYRNDTAIGFQGRYFLPVLAVLTPVLAGRFSHTIRPAAVKAVFIFALLSCAAVIACRYYAIPALV